MSKVQAMGGTVMGGRGGHEVPLLIVKEAGGRVRIRLAACIACWMPRCLQAVTVVSRHKWTIGPPVVSGFLCYLLLIPLYALFGGSLQQ